ncbi:MAG: hypothetical protein K2W96_09445 [Gemmataceae bacterium]|nr:hypothetical protein [Gemmataceae bacterium]
MGETRQEMLDRLRQGGPMTKKQLGDAAEALESAGFIKGDGKKNPKYALTDAGRQEWERGASEARRREVREDEELAQLRLLDAGKKPTALGALSADHYASPKKNKYALTPAGTQRLRALEARQAAARVRAEAVKATGAMRQELEASSSRWRSALEGAQRSASASGVPALEGAAAGTMAKAEGALAALGSVLAELAGIAALSEAVVQARTEIMSAADQASSVAAEREKLREAAEAHRRELEEVAAKASAKLEELAKKAEESPAPASAPVAAPASVDEAAAWTATQEAHRRLKAAKAASDLKPNIPELSDAVLAQLPGLTAARFRELLMGWRKSGRVILEVANDRKDLERAGEGIEVPSGLLYFVHLTA